LNLNGASKVTHKAKTYTYVYAQRDCPKGVLKVALKGVLGSP